MHMGVDDDSKRYVKLIKTFQKMYQNGFHIVSYVPNYCQEKTLDFEKKYHTHFDLLLVNKSQWPKYGKIFISSLFLSKIEKALFPGIFKL